MEKQGFHSPDRNIDPAERRGVRVGIRGDFLARHGDSWDSIAPRGDAMVAKLAVTRKCG